MSRLVIAEKPSVAQSIASVLGAANRRDGYLEGAGYLVSWCFGHLAELPDASAYNSDYAKWRYEDLPILPEKWQYSVASDKKKQFDLLKKLMERSDVTEVVNACDAGREGESIFRTVYNLTGCKKPMLRPVPVQSRLAGGDQCHPAFQRAVPPHFEHRACDVPNAGPDCPAGGRDQRLQAGPVLYAGSGLRRIFCIR